MSNVLRGKVVITAPGVDATFQGISDNVAKSAKAIAAFGGGVKTFIPPATSVINNFKNSILPIPPALDKVDKALKKTTTTSSAATQSLINLGRVVQDAPFGFIGIANNLNPLLESFQRLKKETGSTGEALKDLAGSLVGAGGLGLALSVVTSLLTVFELNSQGAKKETEELKKETDAAAEKQKEFQAAVDSAAQSLLTQAKNLKDIRAILESTTATTEQLTAATINQGVAQLIFDQKNSELQKVLSAEIEKQFLLRSRIGGLKSPELISDPQLDRLKQLNKSLLSLGRSDQGLINTISRIEQLNDVIGGSKGSLSFLNSITGDLQKFFSGFVDGKKKVKDVTGNIIELAKFIQSTFNTDLSIQFSEFDSDAEAKQKALKTIGQLRLFFDKNTKNLLSAKRLFPDTDIQIPPEEVAPIARSFSEMFEGELKNYFNTGEPLDRSIGDGMRKWAEGERIREAGRTLAKTFNDSFGSAFINGIESIGEGIGNALSGKSFGAGIVNVIGDLLTQLGKALIAYGAIKAGLDKILGPGGIAIPGATAIVLGVAATAFGAVFKNFKGSGGRAAGGGVSAGQPVWVGEGGKTELFVPNTGGNIIPNNKLGGVGSGGGLSIKIVGEFVQRGKDLVAVVTLANQSNTRLV